MLRRAPHPLLFVGNGCLMLLTDTHCHLDFPDFDADRAAVLAAARARSVGRFIIPAVGEQNWSQVMALTNPAAGLYGALGIHPLFAASQSPGAVERLAELLATRPEGVIAIGECGLDRRSSVEQTGQLALFEAQLELAEQRCLPLLIHSVRANDTVASLLKRRRLPAGGIIHAFSGSLVQAERFWALGFCLGIGGTITYERANKTREAVAAMPWASLLLETDAPDMPLSGHQGERNTPAHLPEVLSSLAELKGVTAQQAAEQLAQNSVRLFPQMAADGSGRGSN